MINPRAKKKPYSLYYVATYMWHQLITVLSLLNDRKELLPLLLLQEILSSLYGYLQIAPLCVPVNNAKGMQMVKSLTSRVTTSP